MARIFKLTKMPSCDFRMLLCDDGNDSERRNFKSLLGDEFYETTVMTVTNLMRPEKSVEDFMQDVLDCNPGSSWIEVESRVWQWKGAQRKES